jgi:protein-tyrosine phosphatase
MGLYWHIESAGTAAHDGAPMDQLTWRVLHERGIDVFDWTSHRLTEAALSRADLILTSSTHQRALVVTTQQATIGRTFNILQFARLVGPVGPIFGDDGAKLGLDLLSRAVASRHHVQAGAPGEEDIADPMGKRLRGVRKCADEIQGAIDRILKPIQSTRGVIRSVAGRY